jgi:hypothetical protein
MIATAMTLIQEKSLCLSSGLVQELALALIQAPLLLLLLPVVVKQGVVAALMARVLIAALLLLLLTLQLERQHTVM